jgi:serine/threonine-protein kinase ULK/ATG1
LEIPRRINNISAVVEDALRKMLVVDPRKRIEWSQLFSHKITYYKEEQIK